MLITAVIGCFVISFVMVILLHKFLFGLALPFIAGGLSKLTHMGLMKAKKQSEEEPPQEDSSHLPIQHAIILGGFLTVGLAFAVSKVIPLEVLGYSALATSLVAFITIAWEQNKKNKLVNAAKKAKEEAFNAQRLAADGDFSTAEEKLAESLLTTELAYGSYHPQIVMIVLQLANLTSDRGRTDAAGILFERAVKVNAGLRESTELYIKSLYDYAEHLRLAEDYKKGLVIANRAVAESKKVPGRDAWTGRCYLVLSRLQAGADKLQAAYESSLAAAKALEKGEGKSHPTTLEARGLVANHCISLGRVAEADRILRETLAEKEHLKETEDEDYLNLLIDLYKVQSSKDNDGAWDTLKKATATFRAHVGPEYERAEELTEKLPAFLARGGAPDSERLYQALFAKETMTVRDILSTNQTMVTLVDASGWTLLQWSAFLDLRAIVEMLISKGADHSFGKDTDLPALYVACRWGKRQVITTLCALEADLEITTGDGSRPIHGAIRSGDQLTYDMLASRDVDVETPNKRGWTPLHEAAYLGDRKFVLQLISKGVDINFQAPTSDDSPLHAAVLGGHVGAAETLIFNMADIHAENAAGISPLRLAEQKGNQEMITLLRSQSETQAKEAAEEAAREAAKKAQEARAAAQAEAEAQKQQEQENKEG